MIRVYLEPRIDAAIDGRSREIELDTRFEKIGGGPGWQLIYEEGPYARTKLFSDSPSACAYGAGVDPADGRRHGPKG